LSCPFCPLRKLTEWFCETPDGIVACRDLNDRGYKYRILIVRSGWHRSKKNYPKKEIDKLLEVGKYVAQKHIQEGRAKKIEVIDAKHFTIKDHFHIQVCMR